MIYFVNSYKPFTHFFSFLWLALGQYYDCTSATEITLKDTSKTDQYQTTMKPQTCSQFMLSSQIAILMWPTWGPPRFCWPQVGPMLAPWTLLSGMCTIYPGSCSNTWYPSDTHLQPESIKISFAQNGVHRWPMILKVCNEYSIYTAMHYAKFQNDWAIKMDTMVKQCFCKVWVQMNLGVYLLWRVSCQKGPICHA